jgi:hypothetical protein
MAMVVAGPVRGHDVASALAASVSNPDNVLAGSHKRIGVFVL